MVVRVEEESDIAATAATVVGLEEIADDPEQPNAAPSWRLPVVLYLGILAVMVFVSWQSITHFTPIITSVMEFPGDGVLGGLTRYDGGWYWLIANDGYSYYEGEWSSVAFFPAYPMTMRFVGDVIGDYALAGILVTALCGLGIAVLFWQWARERLQVTAAVTALVALLLYPYGYYLYGVIYADAFFIFFGLLAFWAIERDHLLLAAVAGAIATGTRPVGVAVFIGLVIRLLERRGALTRPGWLGVPTRLRLSRLRPRDGLILLSVSGLVLYCVFLWSEFGNPFLFSEAEKAWGQEPGPRTWFKIEFFEQVRYETDLLFTWGLMVQATFALCALACAPAVGRRFGWGYAAYMAVVLLVPLVGTKDFMGLGRYVIAAWPAFAVLGQFLAERPTWVRYGALACSGLLLVGLDAGFANGRYLS